MAWLGLRSIGAFEKCCEVVRVFSEWAEIGITDNDFIFEGLNERNCFRFDECGVGDDGIDSRVPCDVDQVFGCL